MFCRYSGITEEQLRDVKVTLADVQAHLVTLMDADTILVGHSLENDLRALKVRVILNT
jgi:RNA exonuclease 1